MRRDLFHDLVIALGLFALSLWYSLDYVVWQTEEESAYLIRDQHGRWTEFHRDEARWIHRSYFLEELLHPDAELWRRDTLLTMGQPPLGNYLMGIGLLVQGRELKPNGFYDFTKSISWNRIRGNFPQAEDLYAGRRTNAVVGALTVCCVYFIGRRLANRVAGVVAALILIPHPLNVHLSTFAGSDALLVFLVAAAGLVAISLADRPTWPKALLLGVLLGLGGATKLSPLLLSLPLAGLGLALLLHGLPARLTRGADAGGLTRGADAGGLRRGAPEAQGGDGSLLPAGAGTSSRWNPLRASARPPALAPLRSPPATAPLGWMLLTLPAVAFATFVAVYPYLWPDPIGRTDRLFEFRTAEMAAQGEIWEQTRVNGPFEAIDRVEAQLGDRTSTSRWLAAEFEARFDRTWDRPDLDLKLGALGLVLLAVWALMYGPSSRYALGVLVIGGQAALIIVGMQVDFNRYHLPVLLAVVIGAGFLAGQVWNGCVLLGHGITASRGRPIAAGDPGLVAASPLDLAVPPPDADPRPATLPAPLAILAPASRSSPGRIQPLLLAAALGLGVLIGHSWAGLRALTERARNGAKGDG